MTRTEILWSIAINGFMLIVGAVCGPLFKKLWAYMNRPSPLTPKTKGQLTESLAMSEIELERLNHLNSHPKDLYLYFYNLLFTILFLLITVVVMYAALIFFTNPYNNIRGLGFLLITALADVLCLIAIVESSRLSDKKIQGQIDRVQNTITETKKRLNSAEEQENRFERIVRFKRAYMSQYPPLPHLIWGDNGPCGNAQQSRNILQGNHRCQRGAIWHVRGHGEILRAVS